MSGEITRATTFNTIPINVIGSTTPTVVVSAEAFVRRAFIKNNGAVSVFLGDQTQNLANSSGPSTGVVRIDPGDNDVYVLIAGQALYGIAPGAGARLSISVSVALPLDIRP